MTGQVTSTAEGRRQAHPRAEQDRLLAAYHQVMDRNSAMKRLNERWVADPSFRAALALDAAGTLDRYRLLATPEDVRSLLDGDLTDPSAAVEAMWQIVVAKTRWVQHFYRDRGEPDDPRIQGWRRRQIARQLLELGPFPTRSNIHSSLTVELSKGCSVGCWFCALSPGRLESSFRYDESNGRLWRGVLDVLSDVLGPGVRTGFLYWASDPFDNPDYERFCVDFADVTGVFPPTTTALALRNPGRTRDFLRLARRHGCWLNRFSVLGLRQLDAVHTEFSPRDLAHVECVPLNRESAFVYGNAGRFRERAEADPGLLARQRGKLRFAPWYTGDPDYADTGPYPLESIGCVTGFLLNMVDRSVELISPCAADDRWPTGNRTHFRGTFDGPEELREVLARAIDEAMPPGVRPGDCPRFHPWLDYRPLADGFELTGRFNGRVSFRDERNGAAWLFIGERVREGTSRADETLRLVTTRYGVTGEAAAAMLDELLCAGVLDHPGA